MSAPILAIDAMGGDFGPRCIVPACISSLAAHPQLQLILVGDAPEIESLLAQHASVDRDRLHVHPASEQVAMDEPPAQALRGKPDSSMRRMLELVRDGQADGCVSAGNSGALMALSRHVLGMLPGIDRPAMTTSIPTAGGSCLLLDLGANVDCSAHQLLQFAVMGRALAQIQGAGQPRVGLLNVGTESIKGNQQVQEAALLLERAQALTGYCGFVEGDGVYQGKADVVVCDGFAGNVLLKASEGVIGLLLDCLEAVFSAGWRARLAGWLARPMLQRLREQMHPARYNGAGLLGLAGVVVKSHGSARAEGFAVAITEALTQVREGLPARMAQRLDELPAIE